MESFFSFVVFALIVLIIVSSMRREKHSQGKEESLPAGKINGTGSYNQEVVGESHYQEAIGKVIGKAGNPGCVTEALLILEKNNQHDRNAVRVTINGMTVGYLPREDAIAYRQYLRNSGVPMGNYRVSAKIFGGGEKYYGVWLDVTT